MIRNLSFFQNSNGDREAWYRLSNKTMLLYAMEVW